MKHKLASLGKFAFIWGAGLLVIWMGLRGVVLRVAGTPSIAVVTDLEEYDSDDGYGIDYAFWMVNDQQATGTVHVRVSNESEVPAVGAQFRVYYLRWAPLVNQPASDCHVTIYTFIFVASGVYWLYLMNKPAQGQGAQSEEEA